MGEKRHLAIRSTRSGHSSEAMPCDCSARFFFQFDRHDAFDDSEFEMIFNLASGDRSGIVGGAVALDVRSNYPECRMGVDKFTIVAARQAAQARAVLPADYVAQVELKFWTGNANLSRDDCIWFNVSYRHNAGTAVPLMETAFYPWQRVVSDEGIR